MTRFPHESDTAEVPVAGSRALNFERRGSLGRNTLADINRYITCIYMAPRRLYNFYIDPDLAAGLKVVKARDGVPEGESIRRAVREYLEKKGVMKTERKRAVTRRRPNRQGC